MTNLIPALRTPESHFDGLPDYPFSAHYAEVGHGLRMHYVDEHVDGKEVVLMLHGEPSWSFLYRKMIPLFVQAGYRAIAPDLIGFGKSDKPLNQADYTYERHVAWLKALLFDTLDLQGITLFAQDWGGLTGLRLLAEHPQRFKRVVLANTFLPTGDQGANEAFLQWQQFSQRIPVFETGRIIRKAVVSPLPPEVVAAYDAPYPDESYKAGARKFPLLVPTTPDNPAAPANRAAWQYLLTCQLPFLTLFSDKDPIMSGLEKVFQKSVPGAAGQPHGIIEDAGHFLQEDKGEELAEKTIAFMRATGCN